MAPKKKTQKATSTSSQIKPLFNLSILTMLLIAAYFIFLGPSGFLPVTLKVQERQEPQLNVAEVIFAVEQTDDSGEQGFATFTGHNGTVTVDIALEGTPDVAQPAHIHEGSCAKLGDITMPLSNVVDGRSTTNLTTSLDQLGESLPLALNVHMSETDIKTGVACVDLSF
jgi:hypothetical protein